MPRSNALPSLARAGAGSDFLRGFGLLLGAWRLIFRSRRLFALSAVCAVVTLVTLVALAIGLWRAAPELLQVVFLRPESWYGELLWQAVRLLIFVLLFVIGANVVPLLLLAPLQDPLSEVTEALCGEGSSPPFRVSAWLSGLVTSIAHTVARILVLLGGHAVLLLLHLVPVVGGAAWTVLATLWTIAWMAGEHLGTPMARHLYRFGDVHRALRARLALCLGFGTATYLLLWIPILNAFFIPVAVVGGTLLFQGLRAAGDVPPPPPQASARG